jgi:Dolichyl-phosphate-mannose-protein mannosyltransferase
VAAALPLVALGLLWALVHEHRARLGLGALSACGTLVAAYVAANGLVVATAEVPSVGEHLAPGVVQGTWVGIVVVLAAAVAVTVDRSSWRRPDVSPAGWAVVGLGAAYVVVLATAALRYRPASSDSLMYHLPRVEHWIQNGTVAPYATHFPHQVEMAPLHEYSMLQLHLLAGTDRFDGLVSLLAYLVAAVGVAEATRLLGGDRRAQLVAAVLALTLPSAVLQASGTHNDLFAGTMSTSLLVLLLAWPRQGPHLVHAGAAGLAAGLAVLAKGTLLVTVGPALVALSLLVAARELRGGRWRRLAGAVALAAAVAALAAGPFLGRNAELTGSALGSDPDHQQIVDPTLEVTAANTIRHLAGNFRIGDGEPGLQTAVAEMALRAGWRAFDATGVAADDQRYAMGFELDAFELVDHTRHQRTSEYGANPVHAVLAVVVVAAMAWALVRRRGEALGGRWERWCQVVLAGGLVAGLVLMAGLLRWQMYATRFQIAPLLIFAALAGLLVARWGRAPRAALLGLVVVASLPMAFANTGRPLVGDDPTIHGEPFAYLNPYVLPGAAGPSTNAYDSVARTLGFSDCRALGLGNRIQFEYPLWVALEHVGWEGTIASVEVTNDTAAAADPDFVPCAVLTENEQGLLELLAPGSIPP